MSQPNVSRHHADWLSLVEVSGPFVSLPVLLKTFPQGLDARDPAQAKVLRAAYEEWQDNPNGPGKQRGWILHVLAQLLAYPQDLIAEGQTLPAGLEACLPEMAETLRPDFALVSPAGSDKPGQAHMLIMIYPSEQALDKPVMGKLWKATPATRMMELLHGADVPLGLVSNGEQWMLVYAPRGEITGYTSWYASLWLDEPITLRAFHSLLSIRRFFGVAEGSTLQTMLKESAQDQQEVTDQLGYQVREAVEVLVQSFDALDKESNRVLLKGVSAKSQYEAALTIMMRLVFLFSAEERDLLHLGKPLYDENYAVSTLQVQLQEVADRYGEEVLERRYDAWTRLLATFRAVHGGVDHQDLMMQAYGGSLFDPDRYPFLEGRSIGSNWRNSAAEPLAVNNRVVLHLLNSLQRLRTKNGPAGMAETRRVSFRALGVEQIGHVYEGLLDHTAVRANEVVLGISGTRKKEPEIPLSELEALLADSQDKLINFLKDETGRSASALRKALEQGSLLDEHKLLLACGQDQVLLERLRPFVGIIRDDSFERPLVVLPGSAYVTAGTTRRSTGTHYTPPTLTEPVVQHTLEPLVYQGPAEGWPREQWQLKSPKQILSLKVCDMAMGSGAFLVQACRYLAERLVEAWENEEKRHPGEVLTSPEGEFSKAAPSERLIPQDAAERIAVARRVVADRCLYGVDINPMAVEMAKLSMWLITVDKHRSFTFLDHAFKCGDSLLGITSLKQLENFSLQPEGCKQTSFATLNLFRHIEEATKKREALEAMSSDTPEQISAKSVLYEEAEEAITKLYAAADVLISVEIKGLKGRAYEEERQLAADHMMAYWAQSITELRAFASKRLKNVRCFHWGLAFPEVINHNGFDAFIGNPPFLGGRRISFRLGQEYYSHLQSLFPWAIRTTDLCVYFLRRTCSLLKENSVSGLILSDIITQGDSREAGIAQLCSMNFKIICARSSRPWPGTAGVKIVDCHFFKGNWNAKSKFDSLFVNEINAYFRPEAGRNAPLQLRHNSGISFSGHYLGGQGFLIGPDEVEKLILVNPDNADVIFDYIKGDELNNKVCQTNPLKAINFGFRDLPEIEQNYPEALEIIRERVKPERDLVKRETHRERWWRYADARPALAEAVKDLSHVLLQPYTAKYVMPSFYPSRCVFAHPMVVIADSSYACFASLQSTFHTLWVWNYCATNLDLLAYTADRVLATYPFPQPTDQITEIGQRYAHRRDELRISRSWALTELYNRVHNPTETDSDILGLRELHVKLDLGIAIAYGWRDLDFNHDFHETKQGIRFTISEAARLEVLDRLLELNHQRYAEEIASGLHDKKSAKSAGTGRGRKKKTEPAAANEPEQFQIF
ncbi:type IIL restriction-modification enzyme MmeI [Methylomonas sp. ZR1]|uniref:Eco57I restriction-modification methylase domain-containing protein n=1 Tax=Methylomonas sp. ZR1 TaxID=1797072 RepID=UPI001490B709|nr:type IIL restriction-modification enzyme MmeI [Methylomonas sp. ZR1]NOV30047.1 restriction endonuclease [Methylomonas sp. ZR1]